MKANITYQNYGTSILCFIKGNTTEDAYGKWLSLFNWGATSTDPNYVADNVISCWSTMEKFQRYLFNFHENRLWHNATAFKGPMDLACAAYFIAKAEFEATASESFRSINNDNEPYEFGTICAEKPDENFEDAVLEYSFSGRNTDYTRAGNHH